MARARFHRPDEASFLKMAIVSYTNVCVARCDYCAFYRFPGQPDTYLLSFEQVAIRSTPAPAAPWWASTAASPDLGVEHYTGLFSQVGIATRAWPSTR